MARREPSVPEMGSNVEVRRPSGDADLTAASKILGWAFGFPEIEAPKWLERSGTENVRLGVVSGEVQATAVQVPMGQWFGGRSVPMTGIAGVAVAPPARGRGVGAAVLGAVLGELAQERVALSALWPTTQTLYRAVGYELAGSRYRTELRLGALGALRRTLELEPLGDSERRAVRELYAEYAAGVNGHLDRGDYVWQRIEEPRDKHPTAGYLLEDSGEPRGYAYLVERPAEAGRFTLIVKDAVALDVRAQRSLLALLADHRSLVQSALLFGPAVHPLTLLVPEATYTVKLDHHFMLRIVDVAAALGARGYPPLVSVELGLEVTDALLAQNNGHFALRAEGGRARVERARSAHALRLDVRALAALYSGFAPPATLARLGLIEGGDQALQAAAALFGGAEPCMLDMY